MLRDSTCATTGTTSPARSFLEGIALDHLPVSAPRRWGPSSVDTYSRMVVSGGGSNSDLLMQIFADIFGPQVSRSSVHSAAGLGSATCAVVGAAPYGSFDDAVKNMVSFEPAFVPDARNHSLYQQVSAVYDQIKDRTDRIFEQSYEIFG